MNNSLKNGKPKSKNSPVTNAVENDKSRAEASKVKSILRCPKCRSINPINAKYCQQCGKVFSLTKSE